MLTFTQIFALGVSIIIIYIASKIWYSVLEARCEYYILNSSRRYHDLKAIRKGIEFHDIKPVYSVTDNVNSKNQYDTYNDIEKLKDLLQQHEATVLSSLKKASENKELWSEYVANTKLIFNNLSMEDAAKIRVPYHMALQYENRACKMLVCSKPIQTFSILVNIQYISPKGRSQHRRSRTYGQVDIEYQLKQIKKEHAHRKTDTYKRAHERKLLTKGLRYDIMKRDGFHCVLCGEEAHKGFKLHVDHIYPVSRGGKTVSSNLRTLCQDCNVGKSAKYDYNGVN